MLFVGEILKIEDIKMEILLSLSIALFAGLMLSRVAKLFGLPAVTAYLVAGILIGPFCLGRINIDGLGFSSQSLETFGLISDVALGFIAFAIGNEFRLSQLKSIGKQATIIGMFQALFTTVLVDFVLIGLHLIIPKQFPLEAAIIMGAIASATAPAATLMVVRQYKAKGPVTDVLLPVVALDDAVGLIIFSISFGIAGALIAGQISIVAIIVEPLVEVILSVGLGALIGYVFTFFEKFFHSRSKRLSMTVAFVFLTVAISMIPEIYDISLLGIHIKISPLLSCMMLGTVFCNICDFSEQLMDRLDRWTAPILILFFVISGAELDLSILTNIIVVLIGIVYIVSRCIGKYFGASISAKMSKSEPNIRKYLGITLFPQAGVALGMAIMASELGGGIGIIVQNLTLFSVLIYELIGPYLTKTALIKAGEIDKTGKTSQRNTSN